MKEIILQAIKESTEEACVRKHLNKNEFDYSEIERNIADRIMEKIGNRIDLVYLTGVFNVSGLEGLHDELTRLKTLDKSPKDLLSL